MQRGALSALLDIAGPLRATLIEQVITQGIALDALLADDAALTAFVKQSVGGTWHPVGTCRMSADMGDRDAVTDPQGRLRGFEGLRVIDASLMPTAPRGNTNIPTIMLAEKISAGITAS